MNKMKTFHSSQSCKPNTKNVKELWLNSENVKELYLKVNIESVISFAK